MAFQEAATSVATGGAAGMTERTIIILAVLTAIPSITNLITALYNLRWNRVNGKRIDNMTQAVVNQVELGSQTHETVSALKEKVSLIAPEVARDAQNARDAREKERL